MSGKKRGLGRGLDALLGGSKQSEPESSSSSTASSSTEDVIVDGILRQIPVEQIARGQYQPRRHFDQEALAELAD